MDFTQLDKVIEQLHQQLEKKTLSPGSPPVMEHGHLGIWRNIRGFDCFLEIVPGAGRYNFGGKSYKGGKVLVGPPSLTGQDINSVKSDVWNGLSGSGTKENFNITPSEQGISALKTSIRSSLKQDDTRRAALEDTTDLQKLIQIARSAGFTDAEVKEALGGKVFRNALGTEDEKAEAKPSNVVDIKTKQKPQTVSSEETEELPDAAGAEKPFDPTPPGQGKMTADGGLAAALNALKVPGIVNADKKRKIGENLEEASKGIKNEFFRKQIEGYAHGLKTGDFRIEDVRQSVKDLLEHRKKALIAQLSDEDINKLHDKALAKDTVKIFKERAAEAEGKPFNPETEAADRYFYEQLIDKLAGQVRDAKTQKQLVALRAEVKSKRLGGNSLILRLLQILRFILAFIPGG